MSQYGDYIKERLGDSIVERAEGFATYRFLERDGIKSVYIVDIYVGPLFRATKVASEMADEICKAAKEKGCTKLIGSVVPSSNGSTTSLRVLLGYGMTLKASTNDFITFEKEI